MHSGGTAYVETGGTEPIEVVLVDKYMGALLVGKTDISVRVRRHADDYFLDWHDNTMKPAVSVVQLYETLSEVDSTWAPGVYRLDTLTHPKGLNTANITGLDADDILEITVTQQPEDDAAGLPVGFELKVGNFIDVLLRTVALQKENYYIDQMVYNTPGLLTAARIRLFRTQAEVLAATDGGVGEGEFATYTFSSVPDGVHTERATEVRSTKTP